MSLGVYCMICSDIGLSIYRYWIQVFSQLIICWTQYLNPIYLNSAELQ